MKRAHAGMDPKTLPLYVRGFPAHAGMDPYAESSMRTKRLPRARGDGP